jgi:KTSC domain
VIIAMPSTVISYFFYNAESALLTVVFVSGTVYAYKNVPEPVYQAMKKSTSKGSFLNKNIKGVYHFEKLNN